MDLVFALTFVLLVLLYFWIAYNVPILAVGVRRMFQEESKKVKRARSINLPFMSVVVPAKDEERVMERLLNALVRLDYPAEKKEIVIVEDGSTDRTAEICRGYAKRYPDLMRYFHRDASRGKPSALNYGFRQAKGEVVAVFDADNVPEPDVLLKAADYFQDPSVAAVQGTTCALNAEENMLTKIISYEEAVWLRNYLQGKDALKLFVPLTGSCQFVRRDVAEKIGYWDEDCLAEDLEMSARMTEKGYNIKFGPDLVSWQEAPSKLPRLVKQRIRWYRGYMDVALKYGRFLKKFKKKTLDAEVTLMGPYVLASTLLSTIMSLYISIVPVHDPLLLAMTQVTLLFTMATLLTAGVALMYATRPMRFRNLLWLPFIYSYWSLQCFLTAYAFLQVVFRRPRRWVKTEKTGGHTRTLDLSPKL